MKVGHLLPPQHFAIEIECNQLYLIVVVERHKQTLSVTGDGRGRLGVLRVILFRNRTLIHFDLPDLLPRLAIKSHDTMPLVLFESGGQVDAVTHHGRRGVTTPRNLGLPRHVLPIAELGRDGGLRGNPIS